MVLSSLIDASVCLFVVLAARRVVVDGDLCRRRVRSSDSAVSIDVVVSHFTRLTIAVRSFTRVDGASLRSYGSEVALSAGVPSVIVDRAVDIARRFVCRRRSNRVTR